MTSTQKEDKRIVTIELPANVITDLKVQAARNQRSLSGEMRYILINASKQGEGEE